MDWEDRIRKYLDANKGSLRFATIDDIVKEVRLYVLFGIGDVADKDVRLIVARWAIFNQVWLLPEPLADSSSPSSPKPLSSDHESELVSGVKQVIGVFADGVTLGRGAGSLNLKVTGPTAKLKTPTGSASVGISWGGTLKLKAESGPFHFTGELSKDKWELQLNFPDDDAVPNLPALPKVFADGARGVQTIAGITAKFPDLPDVATIGALVKPHVAALEESLRALSGVPPATKKSGKSFGFRLGSPPPLPGEEGIPPGIQGTVTFSYWF